MYRDVCYLGAVVHDPSLLCGGRVHRHSNGHSGTVHLCQSPRVVCQGQEEKDSQEASEERGIISGTHIPSAEYLQQRHW